MNIETIFHDYKELNILAKESSEHPHIGKTNLQKDLETVQVLDDNVADITAITHDLGLYSATEEKITITYVKGGKEHTHDFFVDAKHLHIYKDKDFLIEGKLSEDKKDYIFTVYIPEWSENGLPDED